ncbi:MAG: type VII secretion target [Actinomycetota bacterium]|nr:type VII secretion target [Actinomycetota bacterium]
MTEPGFTVDLAELEALAREAMDIAGDVREDVAWKYEVDGERWPADDPLREAVITYQRSLQAAMRRLCGGTDALAETLRGIATNYHDTDADLARRLTELASRMRDEDW